LEDSPDFRKDWRRVKSGRLHEKVNGESRRKGQEPPGLCRHRRSFSWEKVLTIAIWGARAEAVSQQIGPF
jgi:hypothetical protein